MALFGRKKDAIEEDAVVREAPMMTLPEAPELNEAGLRSMEDHIEYLLGLVKPLSPFGMSSLEALNQVLCEDIKSHVDVPAHSTALVSGFAVRAADLVDEEGSLIETINIVDRVVDRLPVLTAIRIEAGERLPRGANAVLPSTYVAIEDDLLRVFEKVEEGEYIRAAGEHLWAGEPLLHEGDVLGARQIGLLASAGIDKVFVRPRPRVVVIGSGEGLVAPSAHRGEGEVIDANSYLIAAAAKAAGAQVFHLIVGTNNIGELSRNITDQLIRADLVISTTGGRREDYEAMVRTMRGIGIVDSAQVASTPGRTQTFGLIGPDSTPMLMLPGNPVSAYVSFQAFGWPLIKKLAGSDPRRKLRRGITVSPLRSIVGQTHLLRAKVELEAGVQRVTPVSEPHALSELAASNALIVLGEDVEHVPAGASAYYWALDEDIS